MTTAERIKAELRIEQELEKRDVRLIGSGNQRTAKCPFHEDSSPSLSVNIPQQLWTCHAGCGGGSVIDLLAKFNGVDAKEIIRRFAVDEPEDEPKPITVTKSAGNCHESLPPPCALYRYEDALGNLAYEVCRYKFSDGKKTFRQRHTGPDGNWIWNMDGCTRVLYHLPAILKADQVWIVEGEKDAENLIALGFVATTNVGGAGKWLESYSESLAEKEIVICGDNDKPGQEHVKLVFDSVSKVAKNVRVLTVPLPSKDVSDFIASVPNPKTRLMEMVQDRHPHVRGYVMPCYTVAELEGFYQRYIASLRQQQLNLADWLPGFRQAIRALCPGELIVIAGPTGVGKTCILQNIARSAKHLPTVFFEAELARELFFERSLQVSQKVEGQVIEDGYTTGELLGRAVLEKMWPNFLACCSGGLTVAKIEEHVRHAELKLGQPARLVIVDYLQLLSGEGKSRYERYSNIAEGLRRMAVETGTIVIVTSQVGRPANHDEVDSEVSLFDAKESGSIENSASLFLGCWRDSKDPNTLKIRVNKCTKGKVGFEISCNFHGATLQITEQSTIPEDQIPTHRQGDIGSSRR